jgi:hypothetical protein
LDLLLGSIKRRSPRPIKLYLRYFKEYGRWPNLLFPRLFSEKLYSRLLNPLPEFTPLSDKVAVRSYVKDVLPSEVLIPQYGVYDKLSVRDLDLLPSSFVLKANHGAGFIKIVKDKKKEKLQDLLAEANNWLTIDYSARYQELHYKPILPKLIVEKALLNKGKPPTDYKVHVFNAAQGENAYIFIQLMEVVGAVKKHFFMTEDWQPTPFSVDRDGMEDIDNSHVLRKPPLLPELLQASLKLAQPFNYVRLDWYIHEDRLYFGEMTFTPAAGNMKFNPEEWDGRLGEIFDWPDKFAVNNL